MTMPKMSLDSKTQLYPNKVIRELRDYVASRHGGSRLGLHEVEFTPLTLDNVIPVLFVRRGVWPTNNVAVGDSSTRISVQLDEMLSTGKSKILAMSSDDNVFIDKDKPDTIIDYVRAKRGITRAVEPVYTYSFRSSSNGFGIDTFLVYSELFGAAAFQLIASQDFLAVEGVSLSFSLVVDELSPMSNDQCKALVGALLLVGWNASKYVQAIAEREDRVKREHIASIRLLIDAARANAKQPAISDDDFHALMAQALL
jgi:hypothetical protein